MFPNPISWTDFKDLSNEKLMEIVVSSKKYTYIIENPYNNTNINTPATRIRETLNLSMCANSSHGNKSIKNTAYGRQRISRPMRIVGPIEF